MQYEHQAGLFEISFRQNLQITWVMALKSKVSQYFKILEDHYQGWKDTHVIADYCFSLKRDCPYESHDRK